MIPAVIHQQQVFQEFEEFILQKNHPCLMAQSVFSAKNLDFYVYPEFGSQDTAERIVENIKEYIFNYNEDSDLVYTFMAVFDGRRDYTEKEFEALLWQQLQLIYEADETPWDPEVNSDPKAADFSFSIAGKAFYLVGMHPNSSRKSRRAPYASIAFNLHQQFENLREKGRYEKVKKRIRQRDVQLQGDINPMLQDFMEGSETRQYSGRKVGDNWKCPFLHEKLAHVSTEKVPEKR